MSENIKLNRKQVVFITTWLEIEDPEKAAEKFMDLMILEKVSPTEISYVIDRVMKKAKEKGYWD